MQDQNYSNSVLEMAFLGVCVYISQDNISVILYYYLKPKAEQYHHNWIWCS